MHKIKIQRGTPGTDSANSNLRLGMEELENVKRGAKSKSKKRKIWFALSVAAVLTWCSTLQAQTEIPIAPGGTISSDGAILQTPQAAAEFGRSHAALQAGEVPFRPTMDATEYQQLKAMARPFGVRPGSTPAGLGPVSLTGIDFDGIDNVTSGNWFPPDAEAAAGNLLVNGQLVSVVNDWYQVNDTAGNVLLGESLNAFLLYGATPAFDPRVVYDHDWNRWVVTADSFPASPTTQTFLLAISKTPDASGGFWIY